MIGWIILAVIVILLAVLLVRAAAFKPLPQKALRTEPVSIDGDRVVENLQKLVRCATVSSYVPEEENDEEFDKLTGMLPELYPNVYAQCDKIEIDRRALLFLWKGKNHGAPDAEASVLMAHYDVVPVEEENWEKPPFAGIIEDGVLWGRGTLDTKVTFNGILTSANQLIGEGFVPEQDIYLAFSGGEEVNGIGAVKIVEYFQKNNIRLSMVVDEGGAVVEDVFPGVTSQCALVGIAEKGMMNVRFEADSAGGHASAPKPHTPIGILADAVKKVEDNPLPMHITPPVAQMFDRMGRNSSFLYKVIFSNLWLFKPVLASICKKSGGELNALVRTTVAFTQASGSKAVNVIPPKASVVANIRINPEDNVESVLADLRSRVGNDAVRVTLADDKFMNPSPISRTDVDGWERVAAAIRGTWGESLLVSPYLMMQCSDSRHYRDISDRVYKFSAMHLTKEERGLIHGNNERITLTEAGKAAEFFYRLMKLS